MLKSDNMEDMKLKPVSPEIIDYVEREIIPRYTSFDKAHQKNHVRMVIQQSLKLAEHTPSMNTDMVYVIAAFHDLGLVNGRESPRWETSQQAEQREGYYHYSAVFYTV